MRIAHKLFLGSLFLAGMIWAVDLYAVAVSRQALGDFIEGASTNLAAKLIDEVDRTIATATNDWLVYASDPLLVSTVQASNRRFSQMPDVRSYIDDEDAAWRQAPNDVVTPFMAELIGHPLSRDLRRRLHALARVHGYKVYGEVFVTNRYGVNVAQSGKTSDYRQDDEAWWQQARLAGVYVSDTQYDESAGIYSTDICARVEDPNGQFLGTVKAVFDLQGVLRILRSSAAIPPAGEDRGLYRRIRLYTADKRLIFSSDRPEKLVWGGPADLPELPPPYEGSTRSFRSHDPEHGELLGACARSIGHGLFPGLGWVLTVEHRARDVYAPARRLRNALVTVAVVVTVAGLGLAVAISTSVAKRLTRLRDAAGEIGKGHLSVRTTDTSTDEIGQLASRFNEMAHNLQETTVSRSYVENILRSMVNALIIVSPQGVILRVNAAACRMLGYSQDELVDRPFTMVLGDAGPLEGPWTDDIVRYGSIRGVDAVYRTRSGRRIPVSFTASVMADDSGEPQAVVCVAADITQRKRTEQELARSNEELERFAYVASHDLQEPLRMVSSFVQLLAKRYEGRLDAEADEYIHYAVDGAKRMKTLITDLLTYSRVRTRGRDPEPTDAGEVVRTVLADLGQAIREAGATVECGRLPVVMADRTQLGQLVQNLLSNAIKYRREQAPRVSISAEADEDMWRFAVRDNGIGIEPKHFERIFVIFQRLHGRGEYPGTGIGLAVCKKIVERHGGRIWVESAPGKGATFYFTLPRKEAASHEAAADRQAG